MLHVLPTAPLTWLALRAIALYQRHLSPRKGFCCALHAAGRGRSCSAYGYRAIARGGMATGLVLLQRRLAACKRASRTPRLHYRGMAYQQGFCDLSCDVGDCAGVVDCFGSGCGGGDCGWPWDRRQHWHKVGPDDYLNNEKALRDRIRQAQARQKRAPHRR
jgi:putative component of membrane protein insertase Oxa1/YidC/SpoIIIJ protein YidD